MSGGSLPAAAEGLPGATLVPCSPEARSLPDVGSMERSALCSPAVALSALKTHIALLVADGVLGAVLLRILERPARQIEDAQRLIGTVIGSNRHRSGTIRALWGPLRRNAG